MTGPVEFLNTDDLVELARRLLGDPPPVRDLGLLTAAAARPQASTFGTDAYPDIWTKAAALLQSVVNNHALIDGNKRLGWLAAAVFLELNGASATAADNDDVYELVMRVATEQDPVEEIADLLRERLPPHAHPRTTDDAQQDQPPQNSRRLGGSGLSPSPEG